MLRAILIKIRFGWYVCECGTGYDPTIHASALDAGSNFASDQTKRLLISTSSLFVFPKQSQNRKVI